VPRIVGHEGTEIKTACGESSDTGGKVHGVVIKLVECQFALQLDEGPEGVAGTLPTAKSLPCASIFRNGRVKPSLSRHFGSSAPMVARVTVTSRAIELPTVKMAGWSMAGWWSELNWLSAMTWKIAGPSSRSSASSTMCQSGSIEESVPSSAASSEIGSYETIGPRYRQDRATS
jgi:hypothetical protein